MFNKTQYKLLIEEYMDKYDVTYTTAKQLICQDLKRCMKEKQVSHEMACMTAFAATGLTAVADDIINNYNLSHL